jgi:hypothetical protein
LNGVTRAVNDPRKLVLAVMALSGRLLNDHRYRVGRVDESPVPPAPGHHRSRPCFAYVLLLAVSTENFLGILSSTIVAYWEGFTGSRVEPAGYQGKGLNRS